MGEWLRQWFEAWTLWAPPLGFIAIILVCLLLDDWQQTRKRVGVGGIGTAMSDQTPEQRDHDAPENTARRTIEHLQSGKVVERTARDVKDAADRALQNIAVGKSVFRR